MRRNAVALAALALAALAITAPRADAQGFGVYEHDACTMGRAGAGVASPCNASAVFFNPAGIVNMPGTTTRWNISVGVTSIGADFAFQDSVTGLTTPSAGGAVMVPALHVVRQFNDRWAAGLGVFAPYGLVSEWPLTFEGRFLGYRSELKSIYIQPTVAWQPKSWLRIGAGFDYIHSSVSLKQRLDLSQQLTTTPGVTFGMVGIPSGTDFADADIEGGSWSSAWHLGVIVKADEHLTFGGRYLLRSLADIQGDAHFTQVPTGILLPLGSPLQPNLAAPSNRGICSGHSPIDTLLPAAGLPLDDVLECNNVFGTTLATQHASTNIALPDQLVLGLAIQFTPRLKVMVDYQWVNWSKFQKIDLVFQNAGTRTLWEDYQDTRAVRFGAEFDLSNKLTVRGGLLYHEGAAPDQTVTPLLPEAERAEQTLGVSIRLSSRGRLDLAYQHINQADRRGRVVEPPSRGPQGTAFNTGVYTGNANLFGASLAWGF